MIYCDIFLLSLKRYLAVNAISNRVIQLKIALRFALVSGAKKQSIENTTVLLGL